MDDQQSRIANLQRELEAAKADVAALTERLRHVRSTALSGGADDLQTDRLLAHPVRADNPKVRLGSAPAADRDRRIAIAERLLAAYHKATAEELAPAFQREGEDMWTGILRGELTELIDAIDKRDAERLAGYLTEFGESFVWFGGVTTCIDGYNRNVDPSHVALTYWDKLLRLGEYLGVLPVENPESGPWGDALALDPEEVVAKIEAKIGISMFAPLGIIHTDGLQIGDRLLHYRHVNALYAALRVTEILDGVAAPRISEYGAGLGMSAYYARKLGIPDYTIFDLPITGLLSGHFLLHACGEDAVCLYGEEPKAGTIRIVPYWRCESADDDSFTLTMNQDGINEIDDALRETYREQIQRTTERYFLSINHENFFPKTAANLFDDPRYRRVYRSPYWPREGYVEELFEVVTGS